MVDGDVVMKFGVRWHEPVNLYGCEIGEGTVIGPFVEVQRGAVIGRGCHICSHAFIAGLANLGDRVFVGHGVMTCNDLYPVIGGETVLRRLTVGNDVTIGSGAVLLPVDVGAGAIIGAGSVVVCRVPTLAVVVGNPARVVRTFASMEERAAWIKRQKHVTIVTPMRDSQREMDRYVRQVQGLDWPAEALRIVVVEGDSVDQTWALLQAWSERDRRVRVVKCDVHRPHYTSVVHPERFLILASVYNLGLAAVDLAWSDYVLMLPDDIEYRPDLLRRLAGWERDCISPFVWMDGVFYDIWAFSIENRFFGPFSEPAVPQLGEPVEMTTIGGTMLIDAAVLRAGVRYGEREVDRDFSRDARAAGFRLWADPTTSVWHRR
jgi:UDP-2-acetamido-3-amino-2,3-dideoxy-glucuronate N-acetyltransferase